MPKKTHCRRRHTKHRHSRSHRTRRARGGWFPWKKSNQLLKHANATEPMPTPRIQDAMTKKQIKQKFYEQERKKKEEENELAEQERKNAYDSSGDTRKKQFSISQSYKNYKYNKCSLTPSLHRKINQYWTDTCQNDLTKRYTRGCQRVWEMANAQVNPDLCKTGYRYSHEIDF